MEIVFFSLLFLSILLGIIFSINRKKRYLKEKISELIEKSEKVKFELEHLENFREKLRKDIGKLENAEKFCSERVKRIKLDLDSYKVKMKNHEKQLKEIKSNIQKHKSILLNLKRELDILRKEKKDLTVWKILETDIRMGYVTEWAPELYKRFFKQEPERAKKWLLEVLARHPNPEHFEFHEDINQLIVDGTPVEKLFALIASERSNSEKPISHEKFISVWEDYVNSIKNETD